MGARGLLYRMTDNYTPDKPMPPEGIQTSKNIPLAKGSRLQEFEVVDVVGEGGFGIVYLANDLLLHRTVAVKEYMSGHLASRGNGVSVVVHSERDQGTFQSGMRSFIAEARLLAQFKHPALVEVLRFWEQNGTAYMAMPYYRGKTLRHVLRETDGEADERRLKSLFSPLLDALEMMHAQHVYHRDFSPDNIMVLDSGAPVLLDLGAARHITGSASQAVTAVLKPGFAPIEQYADDGSAGQGPWTDIYAIGAVLYFCITGKPPTASVSRVLKDTIEPLDATLHSRFGAPFLAGIHHALALKQEDRPQSIAELRSILDMASTARVTQIPATRPGGPGPSETGAPVGAGDGAADHLVAGDGQPPPPTSMRVGSDETPGRAGSGPEFTPSEAGIPKSSGDRDSVPRSRVFLYLSGALMVALAVGAMVWGTHPDEPVPASLPPVTQEMPAEAMATSKPVEKKVEQQVEQRVKTPTAQPDNDDSPKKTAPKGSVTPKPEKTLALPGQEAPILAQQRPKGRASRCVVLLDKISLGIDPLTDDDLDYVKSKCR